MRSTTRRRCYPAVLQEEIVQQVWIEHINQAQDEENWISDLKAYLIGDIAMLNAREAKRCSLIAPDYEVDQDGLSFSCPRAAAKSKDRGESVRLVIPELLQRDVVHHYHTRLDGGHQGVGRTYQRIRINFHWR